MKGSKFTDTGLFGMLVAITYLGICIAGHWFLSCQFGPEYGWFMLPAELISGWCLGMASVYIADYGWLK